ncbi:MAG: phospholipase A [Opitutaceae bacterium]|nr:phospholipase A [Opitutaceae bacterium]
MRSFVLALVCLAFSPALLARIDLLLVPPAEAVAGEAGLRFTLYLNNPTSFTDEILLPRVIAAICSSGEGRQRVQLEATGPELGLVQVPARTRKTIELRLKQPLAGPGPFVALRLEAPASNMIMFELRPSEPSPDSPAKSRLAPAPDLDLATDIEGVSRHISAYDPIYFAIGWRGRFNARFQFSFKYRFLEDRPDEDLLGRESPLHRFARGLHLAYTQTSLWDLSSVSKPFYDTSYKPTIFLLHRAPAHLLGTREITVQYGAQHESNGKAGGSPLNLSRSLNTLYITPTVRWEMAGDHFLEVRPRAIAYFNTEDNRDIARYRGHIELTVRIGRDRGWQLATHARGNPRGHGSLEFDFTLPVEHLPWPSWLSAPSTDPRAALGGYLQVQYFNGYGESLLDYNVRRRDQLRFGFMLVR